MEKTYFLPVSPDGLLGEPTSTTDLPSSPISLPATIATDNRLTVLGGWDSNGNLSRGYWSAPIQADGLGEWTDVEPPLHDMVANASLVASDEWFYSVGSETTRAENIDGAPGQWESTTGTPGWCTAAVMAGEHIYAAPCRREGYDWDSTFVARLDEEGVPQWERSADLPGLRRSGTLLASGPWLLLFGGYNGGTDTTDTIFYTRYCSEE